MCFFQLFLRLLHGSGVQKQFSEVGGPPKKLPGGEIDFELGRNVTVVLNPDHRFYRFSPKKVMCNRFQCPCDALDEGLSCVCSIWKDGFFPPLPIRSSPRGANKDKPINYNTVRINDNLLMFVVCRAWVIAANHQEWHLITASGGERGHSTQQIQLELRNRPLSTGPLDVLA